MPMGESLQAVSSAPRAGPQQLVRRRARWWSSRIEDYLASASIRLRGAWDWLRLSSADALQNHSTRRRTALSGPSHNFHAGRGTLSRAYNQHAVRISQNALVGGVAGRAVTPGSRRLSTLFLSSHDRHSALKIRKGPRGGAKRQRFLLSNLEWADSDQQQNYNHHSNSQLYLEDPRSTNHNYDASDMADSPDDMTSGASGSSQNGPVSPRPYNVDYEASIRLPDSEPASDEESPAVKAQAENPFFDDFNFFQLPPPNKSATDDTLSVFEKLSLAPALEIRRRSRPATPPPPLVPVLPPPKVSTRSIKAVPAAWREKIRDLMSTDDRNVVFAKLPRFELTRSHFGTLLPHEGDSCSGWLNDEIINGYLSLVVAHGIHVQGTISPPAGLPPINPPPPAYFAFNTAFYTTLSKRGPSAVSRWAARAKIGKAALLYTYIIFVPINQASHWTLLLLRPRERRIEYHDSLGGPAESYIKHIKTWLAMELGQQLWKEDEWSAVQVASPAQENGRDCGVFVGMNAKMSVLGRELISAYSQEDMPEIRWRMFAELLHGGFTGDFEP